jgi:TPR repeat protein
MGRRDEPELDELSKLLRRLETMEVAPKQENSRKPDPDDAQPQAEYVGALRGAAPAKVSDSRSVSSYDARPSRAHERQSPADKAGRSASTSAIVIGATTAAVVSSVIVAGLVMWTSGGQNSDERRLTFYAPSEPARTAQTPEPAGVTSATRPSTDTSPPTNAQVLLQRADTYLRSGKPGEARVVLEQAAQLGSGVAALTLGAMYDPGRATQFTNLGLKTDPTIARVWYERAKDLGVAEANDRLAELAAR